MINLFRKRNKDFEVFANEYTKEEKEIIVLTNNQSGGAGKLNNSWDASQYFLAYFDIEKNDKPETIYHLRVRELKNKTVPEGSLPSFYNRFMVVKVIKENIQNEELL